MVAVAILVVDDGDEASVVRHSGEKEVVPCGWDMRTDGDFCRHGWTQSAQSGDDEVAIRGMIIIAGTLSVAHQPLSVFLVKVFSYVWPPTTILRLGVFLQMMEKHGVWQCRGKLWRTVIDIGKSCERLTRGKGPDGTVPFAGGLAWLVSLAKQRMASLCRRHAERCFETLAVQQLQPRWSIA